MFDEIIGNQKIKQRLEKTIKQKTISHSYLFSGVEGIGKKRLAKEFAQQILCLGEKKEKCDCKSCIEFQSQNHPDFYLIEPEENSLKIEQIRNLQKKIIEKPILSEKKVYIIDEADKMTVEAQNCLLKTLEEPPKYIVMMLIGKNENDFLETIQSRCTILKFESISEDRINEFINQQGEQISFNQNQKNWIQGSISRALALKGEIELYDQIEKITNQLQQDRKAKLLTNAQIIYQTKEKIDNILEYLNVIFLEKAKQDIRYINCIFVIEDTKKRLKANSNYEMCIDNMLFRIWEEVN